MIYKVDDRSLYDYDDREQGYDHSLLVDLPDQRALKEYLRSHTRRPCNMKLNKRKIAHRYEINEYEKRTSCRLVIINNYDLDIEYLELDEIKELEAYKLQKKIIKKAKDKRYMTKVRALQEKFFERM